MPCLGGRCSGRPLPFAHGLTVSSNASEGGTILDTRKEEAVDAEREELWKASVRRHQEAVSRRNRAAWFAHFCEMAQSHARIAKDYERRAEELCEEGAP